MKFYRFCFNREIQTIEQGGMIKNTVGGALLRYSEDLKYTQNSYIPYSILNYEMSKIRNLPFEVKRNKGIGIIKKVFKDIPDQIPLFVADVKKKFLILKEFGKIDFHLASQFIPCKTIIDRELDRIVLGDEDIHNFTIKISACFDCIEKIKYLIDDCFKDKNLDAYRVVQYNFPKDEVEQFKGKGFYSGGTIQEYGIPTYKIENEHIEKIYKFEEVERIFS